LIWIISISTFPIINYLSKSINKGSPEKLGDTKTRNAKSEEENKEDEKTE